LLVYLKEIDKAPERGRERERERERGREEVEREVNEGSETGPVGPTCFEEVRAAKLSLRDAESVSRLLFSFFLLRPLSPFRRMSL